MVRPHEQVFAGRCAAVIDPALLHPIVNFHGDDFELASEIGNPPLVLFEQFVAEIILQTAPGGVRSPRCRAS